MTAPRFSNVFVLCTGRCGSLTFSRACGHLSNYTAAHESRFDRIGPERLAYPPGHIEVDNRLSWFLGRLGARFGDAAGYVHLTRDPEAVAQSYARRAHFGIIRAYRRGILYRPRAKDSPEDLLEICHDYVATVTANIEAFLKDRPHVLRIRLETLGPDFDRFCDWAGARGDLAAARAALARTHNASPPATGGRPEGKTP